MENHDSLKTSTENKLPTEEHTTELPTESEKQPSALEELTCDIDRLRRFMDFLRRDPNQQGPLIISDVEWNFGSLVGDRSSIEKICLWEFGRECQPLLDQVELVRLAVRKYYEIEDKKEIAQRVYALTGRRNYITPQPPASPDTRPWSEVRLNPQPHSEKDYPNPAYLDFLRDIESCIDELNRIAGRYNWGLFCSHEFPDWPWLKPGSTCPIRIAHKIWDEGVFPAGVSPNGTHKMPYVSHDQVELVVGEGNTVFIEGFEESLADLVGLGEVDERVPLHVFAFGDSLLDFYNKKDLVASFKHHLDRLDRRKFSLRDPLFSTPTRDGCWKWLHHLGIMRLLNGCTVKEVENLRFDASDRTYEDMMLEDVSSFSDFRRQVPGVFHLLFNLPGGEMPIRWEPHITRAAHYMQAA